jgi:hypothetical protein
MKCDLKHCIKIPDDCFDQIPWEPMNLKQEIVHWCMEMFMGKFTVLPGGKILMTENRSDLMLFKLMFF